MPIQPIQPPQIPQNFSVTEEKGTYLVTVEGKTFSIKNLSIGAENFVKNGALIGNDKAATLMKVKAIVTQWLNETAVKVELKKNLSDYKFSIDANQPQTLQAEHLKYGTNLSTPDLYNRILIAAGRALPPPPPAQPKGDAPSLLPPPMLPPRRPLIVNPPNAAANAAVTVQLQANRVDPNAQVQSTVESRRIKKEAILANLPTFYKNILKDLEDNKHVFDDQGKYRAAVQTVKGLAVLSAMLSDIRQAKDKQLNIVINQLTGMLIHPKEDGSNFNDADIENILMNISGSVQSLESIYSNDLPLKEKIRFFKESLSQPGCLENRCEYIDKHKSLKQQLIYAYQDFNEARHLQGHVVPMKEFIEWLNKDQFFQRNNITQASVLTSTALKNMVPRLIALDNAPVLAKEPIEDRLLEAVTFKPKDLAKGLEPFKKYILENADVDLSEEERKNIDQLIAQHVLSNPQLAKYILS